jgi:hypothetical protein
MAEALAHEVADILGPDAVANAEELGKAFEDLDAELQISFCRYRLQASSLVGVFVHRPLC